MQRLERWLRKLKIPIRLSVGYVLLLLVTLVVGDIIFYYQVKQVVKQGIEQELEKTTSAILHQVKTAANVAIRSHLRGVAEANLEQISSLYRQVQAGKISRAQAEEKVHQQMQAQSIGERGYLYIIDSLGNIVHHRRDALKGVDLSYYPFIQQQIAKKQGYMEYVWKNPDERTPQEKALYMTYFKPWDWIISVSTYRDEFRTLLNIDDFRHSVLDMRFGKTGYPFIINTAGDIIIHPFLEGNFFEIKDDNGFPFFREIINQRNGMLTYSWKNPGESDFRKKLVLFNYLSELDWIVISSTYEEEIYAPLDRLTKLNIISLALILLLVLPLSIILSASIINPLKQLMSRLELAAKGDFSIRMPLDSSKDEIHQLAEYFNRFMQELEEFSISLHGEINQHRSTQRELKKLNIELEQRVLERTQELNASIETLKKAQAQLVEAEKMASLGTVVAGVAHEINTPIGTAITAISFLREQTESFVQVTANNQLSRSGLTGYTETALELTQAIHSSLQRAASLIQSFKGIAVDESRENLRVFNLRELLVDYFATVQSELDSHQITLNLTCDPDLELRSYPNTFSHIISNLVVNSLHHGFENRPSGIISIEVDASASALTLKYRDNGSGMNDKQLKNIFEPFYTTKRGSGGTGLGMHLVYNLVTHILGAR
ncbi:sensor histidine kinase [Dongshaea marina]|uniref:sensor histidine kinase n=1 Tax=Dongshaea marina TaxID=2047966 RepID=UPI000D3E3C4C|nr:cache domain-containing protein [Dongshaea marina]